MSRNSAEFDWYQNWANLRDIISQYIKYDSKILNVGAGTSHPNAGNSPFSEEMYEEGYRNITNIDISEIVVEDMQLKYKTNGYDESLECSFCER
jgi:EEF1A lysine methyltransferase 4